MVIFRGTRKGNASSGVRKESAPGTARNSRKKGPPAGSPGSVFIAEKRKVLKNKKQSRDLPKGKHEDELIRLNKYIASTGLCSRREADDYITAGLVTVNDKLVTELGTKVKPTDVIRYNGEKLKEEKKVYILLNKPKDYITTVEDPHAKRTVIDLIKGACRERVYPVGRLDRNTTGVLLLTNDGELTKRLTHPRFEKMKVYQVELNKGLKPADMDKIATGIMLDDGFIKADAISFIDSENRKKIGIEIHSGRNRIVRRIFEQLGYEILKLDRVYFAGLSKKGLSRGQWRFLTEKEIHFLKMNAFK
ncbi:MAG: rRNA pseudouridine synthase [Bacteroidales bacterium]|nr:rRNA pseudouridine synthase [Bacteroidales bacterium]MBN2763823.1 rRNA pseudouridine synthase [Bacteroidales bacterium]